MDRLDTKVQHQRASSRYSTQDWKLLEYNASCENSHTLNPRRRPLDGSDADPDDGGGESNQAVGAF